MKNRVVKYVIFDFDGTLADSGEIAFKAMNSMSESHGFRKLDWSEIESIRKMSTMERSRYMGVPLIKIPIMAQEFYKYYKEHMVDMSLNEGIGELLEDLHNFGYKIAVISSNDEDNIRNFLKVKGLDNIDDVLCSSHVFSKDRIINKFLRQKGLEKQEVIYVGDEIRDITACNSADISIIWVDWGLDIRENVEKFKPDYMISRPDQVLEILDELEK